MSRIFRKNFLKALAGGIISNRSGKSIREKLVIFESDDWGAIRTPGKEELGLSAKVGMDIKKSQYKVDALASEGDLDDLFNLLSGFKDVNGNNPIFTANSIMANPDFAKIKEHNFSDYFYEPFTKTLQDYPKHKYSFEKWKKGMESRLFLPQFHGREHLNVRRWMNALRADDKMVKYSFGLKSTYSGKDDYSFMEAFDWDDPTEVKKHSIIIEEGLKMFREIFGFDSKSFIAPCYTWDKKLNDTLAKNNVELIQGALQQRQPTGKKGNYKNNDFSFGDQCLNGLICSKRNVFLEPVINPHLDWTDKVMGRIYSAFMLGKPAVISTHRVNYIGYIDPKNKDNGLKHLRSVLVAILKQWPDVKFITSPDLLTYLNGEN